MSKRNTMQIVSKIGVIVAALFFLLSLLSIPSLSQTPQTIYVDGNYMGPLYDGSLAHPFLTISQGLENLRTGDTLYVFNSTYYEHVIVTVDSVTITGENKRGTIIDGVADRDVITLAAFSITLHGFTIRNGAGTGIKIQTTHNIITDTIITNNHGPGISLCPGSSHTTISNNIISDNGDSGISLIQSERNTISGNTIVGNTQDGITLFNASHHNIITENILQQNAIGINISKDSVPASNNNHIYHNNFKDNMNNAYDCCTNFWDNGAISGGNYWSDYMGIDANDDGIGELSYNILGNGNKDVYPFIHEYGWKNRLRIIAPSTVPENTSFQVTVIADEAPLAHVLIEFGGKTYYTGNDGIAVITSPLVAYDITLELVASLAGYVSSSQSITVVSSMAADDPILEIFSPSAVVQGTSFVIRVTALGAPVPEVSVTFSSYRYTSNASGELVLVAPFVQETTNYLITATKNGYQSTQQEIVIQHSEISERTGTIAGVISDANNNKIKDVTVCATRLDLQYCTHSSEDGTYHLSLPPGIYDLSAIKEGFIPFVFHQITVTEESISYKNIQIFQRTTTLPQHFTTKVIQSTLTSVAEAGKLLGHINVHPSTDEEIITYDQDFRITNFSQTEHYVNFTITGQETHNGKYLAIFVGEGTLEDIQRLNITYDGLYIKQVSLDTFFAPVTTDNHEVQWTGVFTIDENNTGIQAIILRIPQFSQHSISLFSFKAPQKPMQDFQQITIALIGAIIVTFCAVSLAYRRGSEF